MTTYIFTDKILGEICGKALERLDKLYESRIKIEKVRNDLKECKKSVEYARAKTMQNKTWQDSLDGHLGDLNRKQQEFDILNKFINSINEKEEMWKISSHCAGVDDKPRSRKTTFITLEDKKLNLIASYVHFLDDFYNKENSIAQLKYHIDSVEKTKDKLEQIIDKSETRNKQELSEKLSKTTNMLKSEKLKLSQLEYLNKDNNITSLRCLITALCTNDKQSTQMLMRFKL